MFTILSAGLLFVGALLLINKNAAKKTRSIGLGLSVAALAIYLVGMFV